MIKNRLLFFAKSLFSIGLIYWLLRDADLVTIWQKVKAANMLYLVIVFFQFYFGYLLLCLRWQTLLKVENIYAPIMYLLASINISVLFNNLLPSTIGGDAYRMYDVWKLGANKTKSILVILIDRFVGMFALICYGLIAALYATEVSAVVPGLVIYLAGIIAAMLVVAWMVFGSGASLLQWFLQLSLGPFSFVQKLLRKTSDGLSLYKGRSDVLIRALLLSFALQLNVVIHFTILAVALHIEFPWYAMFIIIPIATLIMLLPISINGVGVREAVLVFLFAIYGVDSEAAIAFAWVWLAMLLAQGLIGGIVFLLRKDKVAKQDVEELMR